MTVLIKDLKSLCASTFNKVDSRIIEEQGSVFLIKGNMRFNNVKFLIEKNADFYRKLPIDYKYQSVDFDKVMIDVTTKCNLKCPVCYRKLNSAQDISLDALKTLSSRFKRKIISICGGEPTVRGDLSEIIKLFSKKNTVFLITNGVKLSDFEYLKILKKNGLDYVSFSLNALSDEVLSRINENNILNDKVKALENLKELKINTVLATVLVKGVNEGELKGLFNYCLNNRGFIHEFRLRAMAPFGSYLSNEKLCISEMIDIFSREIGFNKADLLKEFELKRAVNEIFQREIFTIKSCSFDFHIKINKRNFYPIAKNLHLEKLFSYPSILRKVMILINVIRLFGSFMAIKGIMKIIFKRELLPWVHPSSILKVGLRSWPDVNTMDLDENKRCKTGYLLNGQVVSFCYANIVRDRLEI